VNIFFNSIRKNDYSRFSRYVLSRENAKTIIGQSSDPEKPTEEEIMRDYTEQLTDIEGAFNNLQKDDLSEVWKAARYKRTEYSTNKKI
jgi:hypothetical protein